MKVMVFLYPTKEYFDASLDRCDKTEDDDYDPRYMPERMDQIINRRYRKKGYTIVWIMFSSEDDSSKPNLNELSEFIKIEDSDEVFSNGMTFHNLISQKVYPDCKDILDRLSIDKESVSDLVVAGFHLWDCVDRFASFAYNQGFNTRVDEDLTEIYFGRTLLEGPIPYNRRVSVFAKMMRYKVRSNKDCLIKKLLIELRKKRPWLESS